MQRTSPRFISCLILIFTMSSCSWITSRRSLFGDSQEDASPAAESVPKEQYDQLMMKYQNLMKKKKVERATKRPTEDPSLVIDQLNGVKGSNELAETVDVFSNNSGASETTGMITPMSFGERKDQVPASMIEEQIEQIRQAQRLIDRNQFDAALKKIKNLEKSPIKQVAVRAKYQWGEILFRQGEYDLAMQIYEEIINKYAFSGLVLKSLGRLIACSEKLKAEEKKEKYYSILHDFFDQGA